MFLDLVFEPPGSAVVSQAEGRSNCGCADVMMQLWSVVVCASFSNTGRAHMTSRMVFIPVSTVADHSMTCAYEDDA